MEITSLNSIVGVILMEVMSSHVGTHVLINVYDVPEQDTASLIRLEVGRPLLDEIVKALDFHVVAETGHQFSPIGYSYAYVLSESHFTIHTYPEYHSCYIDMFCCNPLFDAEKAVSLVKHAFHTDNVQHKVVRR
jgi:S-adenosylmethionine decarboxylase proenzyme